MKDLLLPMISMLFDALISLNKKSFLLKHFGSSRRLRLLSLALSPLSSLVWIFLSIGTFHILSYKGLFASMWGFARTSEPSPFLFLILDSQPMGLLLCLSMGIVWGLILSGFISRVTWFSIFMSVLLVAPIVIVNFVGLISFSGAWLFYLGTVWLLNISVRRAVSRDQKQNYDFGRDSRWQLLISSIVVLLAFLFARPIAIFVQMMALNLWQISSMLGFASDQEEIRTSLSELLFHPNYRLVVFMIGLLTFVVIETFLSMLFFHFYFKKTELRSMSV